MSPRRTSTTPSRSARQASPRSPRRTPRSRLTTARPLRWLRPLIALIVPLVAVVALAVGGTPPSAPSTAITTPTPSGSAPLLPDYYEGFLPVEDGFVADATAISDCRGYADIDCWVQAYGNVAFREGTPAAGALFRSALASDIDLIALCHPIAHGIGIAAVAREQGETIAAMRDGFSDCNNGFYHGVLLRAFSDLAAPTVEAIGEAGRALCSIPEVLADQALTINCVHGTGHGYMIATDGDMERSIAACAIAGEVGFQTRYQCDNGVFMEVFASSTGLPSRYLSTDTPFAPCDRPTIVAKVECYIYASGAVLRFAQNDQGEALRLCGTAEVAGQPICFSNVGAAIGGVGEREPAEVIALCRTAIPAGQSNCLTGAARQIAYYAEAYLGSAGVRAAADYCATGDELAAACYFGLGDLISSYRIGDPVTICATFEEESAVSACLAGARARP